MGVVHWLACGLFLACRCADAGSIEERAACADAIGNCPDYGQSVCTSYADWSRQNCASFCKFCTGSPQTPTQSNCVDVIENCAALGPNLCDTYVEFAHINCQKTCNLCAQTVQCADKLSNCAAYGRNACGGQYLPWAKDNCPKFCNLCSGDGGATVGQTDVCYYKGKAYHEGARWMDGCEKNCTCVDERRGYYLCQSVCPNYQNLPSDCHMETPPGECCGKPVCPSRTGCEYKGHVYKQGEQWNDGCDYKCVCRDGNTGYYECRALCVTWQNIPQCHLVGPAPGKCCQTPSCPSNVVIHYPDGYVPE